MLPSDLIALSHTEEIDDSPTRKIEEKICDGVLRKIFAGIIEILVFNSTEEHDVNPKREKCESAAAYFTSNQRKNGTSIYLLMRVKQH